MDYRRFNIAQLSKETNTCRTTLHEWIRNGWLEHVQIVGSRKKYSIDAFLKAEKLALEEASKKLKTDFQNSLDTANNGHYKNSKRDIHAIPKGWFDNLDNIIEQENQKKTLAAKSQNKHGKRK